MHGSGSLESRTNNHHHVINCLTALCLYTGYHSQDLQATLQCLVCMGLQFNPRALLIRCCTKPSASPHPRSRPCRLLFIGYTRCELAAGQRHISLAIIALSVDDVVVDAPGMKSKPETQP